MWASAPTNQYVQMLLRLHEHGSEEYCQFLSGEGPVRPLFQTAISSGDSGKEHLIKPFLLARTGNACEQVVRGDPQSLGDGHQSLG